MHKWLQLLAVVAVLCLPWAGCAPPAGDTGAGDAGATSTDSGGDDEASSTNTTAN